jgi:arylsulfatase A-like enzyme
VDIVDLFPTICGLSDTKIPATITIDGRSLVPQIHGRPGIPRAWTHNALGKRHGGETLFDGKFRFFRDDGKLIDGRAMPLEKPAEKNDPEAERAKAALQAVFEKLQPDGSRPPVPFGEPVK